jgi:hypothetical protein
MADQIGQSDAALGAPPVYAGKGVDRIQVLRGSDALGEERQTSDPGLVTTERQVASDGRTNDVGALRSITSVRADRRAELRERYGGFYWGSDFIGFTVATFFTIVFLGIISAAAGDVGYQVGAPLPKIGHSVSATTQTIGIGAVVASLIGLSIAYIIGGYTAGRMARFDGAKNGIGVIVWTIIVGVILGAAGGMIGSKFNLASQIHLELSSSTFTTAGLVALGIALVVMMLGAILGGAMGERYHRNIDRDAGVTV